MTGHRVGVLPVVRSLIIYHIECPQHGPLFGLNAFVSKNKTQFDIFTVIVVFENGCAAPMNTEFRALDLSCEKKFRRFKNYVTWTAEVRMNKTTERIINARASIYVFRCTIDARKSFWIMSPRGDRRNVGSTSKYFQ